MSGASGAIVDPYPVFSVHQDSMALLFLLPALDRGLPGTAEAISRSLAWCFGENELGIDFYVRDPSLPTGRSNASSERRGYVATCVR